VPGCRSLRVIPDARSDFSCHAAIGEHDRVSVKRTWGVSTEGGEAESFFVDEADQVDQPRPMKVVNVDEPKTRFSRLLAEVEKSGRRIVICRNGEPIADRVPHRRDVSMAADEKLGAIEIGYDPTEKAGEGDWPSVAR
jgi:antitoxin (DNA-binding transcriptional repressor) of toxin-antitoxin stability system